MDITTIIGENIKGFRKRQQWTQEKLAVRARLSAEFISRVERKTIGISIVNLYKIAKALGVETHKFVIEDAYKEK